MSSDLGKANKVGKINENLNLKEFIEKT